MSLALAEGEAGAIARAHERFAAGSDELDGVRPLIALSWLRCRDRYAVDPGLAFAPRAGRGFVDDATSSPADSTVLTQLGHLAASIRRRLGSDVVTVVDGDGQLVGAWGDDVPGAPEAHLAPQYSWSEATTGTNGMGTALRSDGLTAIRGPEHWCEGIRSLDCLGVAIRDPVTQRAVGAINISAPTGSMSQLAMPLLRTASSTVSTVLLHQARQHGASLVEAFDAATAGDRHALPTLALDVGGRVVIADRAAAGLLNLSRREPSIGVQHRVRLDVPDLDDLVAGAVAWARRSQGWTGTCRLALRQGDSPIETTFTAVLSAGDTIGFIVSIGTAAGGPFTLAPAPASLETSRVVAERRNGRTLLLQPSEISYAEAAGNTVWLNTDHGRVQAAERGLTTLERQLQDHGFLRVHRGYLVNLRRVREVGRGPGHELLLFLDSTGSEPVPVSRGRAKVVRGRLGM